MKSFKILSMMLLLAAMLVGCDKENNQNKPGGGGASSSELVGEWVLTSWNEETPEFSVYIAFNDDATFQIYQQTWTLFYELFEGSYNVSGSIVTGIYSDGSIWLSGYKFAVEGDTLTMYSQEDTSIASVYTKCEIPEEVKAEATTTRSLEVVPLL